MRTTNRAAIKAIVLSIAATGMVALVVFSATGCSAVRSFALGGRTPEPRTRTVASPTVTPQWNPSPYLCRYVIAEQQESREFYRRLAEGQVRRLTFLGITRSGNGARIRMRAEFVGLGDEDFELLTRRWRGVYLIVGTTRGSPPASVGNIGAEEEALGRSILLEQYRSRQFMRVLFSGKVAWIEVTGVDRGLDQSKLTCVAHYRGGGTASFTIEMRYVNGYWYILSWGAGA